mmetsp:Transcript_1695/g.3923  ORF Transcript_1695/g.3923 Transcript_1695/m.3923 type:complete len:249 (-) Transcript_1695:500-1246(-)
MYGNDGGVLSLSLQTPSSLGPRSTTSIKERTMARTTSATIIERKGHLGRNLRCAVSLSSTGTTTLSSSRSRSSLLLLLLLLHQRRGLLLLLLRRQQGGIGRPRKGGKRRSRGGRSGQSKGRRITSDSRRTHGGQLLLTMTKGLMFLLRRGELELQMLFFRLLLQGGQGGGRCCTGPQPGHGVRPGHAIHDQRLFLGGGHAGQGRTGLTDGRETALLLMLLVLLMVLLFHLQLLLLLCHGGRGLLMFHE